VSESERAPSKWAQGHRPGVGPLGCVLLIGLVVLLAIGGAFWIFQSPGFRVATEIYASAPDIVTSAHYSSTPTGDTLTIRVARDVTAAEATQFVCTSVVPLLVREHLGARIVVTHPDGAFWLDTYSCG